MQNSAEDYADGGAGDTESGREKENADDNPGVIENGSQSVDEKAVVSLGERPEKIG